MNAGLLFPLLVTSIVTIVGWYLAHRLAASRDRARKRREQRVQYLIEAWRSMVDCANREDASRLGNLERALADVQLFGSPRQIALAQDAIREFASSRTVELDALLAELRRDLRSELGLGAVEGTLLHIRFSQTTPPTKR